MEEMVKLTLATSIPVWGAIAVFAYFSAYFAGIAGIGVVFISIIIVSVFWNKTLVSFSESIYGKDRKDQPSSPYDYRLRDIESKIDEISRKLKE